MFEMQRRETSGPAPVSADPLARADAAHAEAGRAFRALLSAIAELERTGRYRDEGARDTAHLVQMRYGVSGWEARRMVQAASALERLPHLARALTSGLLGPDKVLELCRFATPATERGLIAWARRVSYGAMRRRGELEERRGREQEERAVRERSCSWYFFDAGRRFHLEADLPAADGARVAAAMEEVARGIPVMPGEEDAAYAPAARRADALVALCTRGGARAGGDLRPRAQLEPGGVADPGAASRLSCNGAVEHVHEDRAGRVLHRLREPRRPPAWMVRQVRCRDGGCTFPGCGTRAFTEAHHIAWYRFGGRTTLENLTLVCAFHHRLVHEHGWTIRRSPDGGLAWLRPDGTAHVPGPVLRGADVDPGGEPVTYGPFGEPGSPRPAPSPRMLPLPAARAGPDP